VAVIAEDGVGAGTTMRSGLGTVALSGRPTETGRRSVFDAAALVSTRRTGMPGRRAIDATRGVRFVSLGTEYSELAIDRERMLGDHCALCASLSLSANGSVADEIIDECRRVVPVSVEARGIRKRRGGGSRGSSREVDVLLG
jgi:hypothetical protein